MNMQAQSLFTKYQSLDKKQRVAFRALIQEENLTHDEVFGHLKGKEFGSKQAAEYLDVSIATFRRKVADGAIKASSVLGRNHLYLLDDLRALKRSIRKK